MKSEAGFYSTSSFELSKTLSFVKSSLLSFAIKVGQEGDLDKTRDKKKEEDKRNNLDSLTNTMTTHLKSFSTMLCC